MMFQWISGIVLILAAAAVAVGAAAKRNTAQGRALPPGLPRRQWIVYGIWVGCVAITAATGLAGASLLGRVMTGLTLMTHVAAGMGFLAGLALLAALWAGRCVECAKGERSRFAPFVAGLFWIIMVLGLGVALTALLAMTPLTGSDGQRVLYELHRHLALALIVVAALHVRCMAARGQGRPRSNREEDYEDE